jgi:hypothetical protein
MTQYTIVHDYIYIHTYVLICLFIVHTKKHYVFINSLAPNNNDPVE